MAEYTITVNEYINQPPSAVGDGSASTDYGVTIVYNRAMLTSALSPAYSDPEGDPAGLLKVVSLPTQGKLKLNGINVFANQIIDFTDIDAGLFVYIPDVGTISTYDDIWNFQIADTVSGIFVG